MDFLGMNKIGWIVCNQWIKWDIFDWKIKDQKQC
jgi:hypothetical protein